MESELNKLAPALVALQAELQPVGKTADNPFFKSKYAPLPEVMESIQPLLAKHKLAVSQFVTHLDGQSALRTILLHESGQCLQDVQPLLLAKQDPQGQGSAITYARRYGVMAVLGLVADEDDDGNAASQAPRAQAKKPAETKPAASPNKEASEKQVNLIRILAERKGKSDDWINAVLRKVKTSADASAVIDQLNELVDEGAQ